MNKYLSASCLTFLILTLITPPLFAQDQLGVFFDAEGTTNSITSESVYSQIPAWVQLVDASATGAINAFEFRLEVHSDGPAPILAWTLPPNALNLETEPVFMVGLGTPLTITPRVTLAEVLIIVPEAGQTVWLTVHPLKEPSLLDPPSYGYPICSPVYATEDRVDMQVMDPISGCDSEPVASINPDGNPPEISIIGIPPAIIIEQDPADKTINLVTMRNDGSVSLSGQIWVEGTSPVQFEINGHYYTSGPISFQVPVGATTSISPRYDGSGSLDATIEIEVCGDRWSVPVGNPNPEENCAWTEPSHDFGEVTIGQTSSFEVGFQNLGYEPLTIPNSFLSENFRAIIVNHPVSYLNPGETCTYNVVFEPTITGPISEEFVFGENICSLELIGVGLDSPSVCMVFPTTLDYNDFVVGSDPVLKTFTIQNHGGGLVEGTASLYDPTGSFTLLNDGSHHYSLGYNEIKQFTVKFSPSEIGDYSAEVNLGINCSGVTLTGQAVVLPPECALSTLSLEYEEFIIGSNASQKFFQVSSRGSEPLEITAVINDPNGAFSLRQDCTSPFTLNYNQTKKIYVLFDPPVEGQYAAEVDLGLECGTVALTGSARLIPPECNVSPSYLDFPDFVIGDSNLRKTVSITNSGGGTLQGEVTLNDESGAFTLGYNGLGPYSIPPNQNKTIYVYFNPEAEGNYSAELNLGQDCEVIPLTGTAISLPPQCGLDHTSLNFGEFIVGANYSYRYLRITNTGGGTVTGMVSLEDESGAFSLSNGSPGQFILTRHQYKMIRVNFAPDAPGEYSAVLTLGTDCGTIPMNGTAVDLPPECSLNPSAMAFGNFIVGQSTIHSSLQIRNTGGGHLEGNIALLDESGAFSLNSYYSGPFALQHMDSRYINVGFNALAPGTYSAQLDLGLACGVMDLVATAVELPSECLVSSTFLEFDQQVVGGTSQSKYFQIRNTGGGLLTGAVSLVDTTGAFQLSVPNGSTFSLSFNQTTYYRAYYSAPHAGSHSAQIDLGLSCDPIGLSGNAIEMDPMCALSGSGYSPGELNLEPMPLGGTQNGYLVVRNTGGGLLTGQITLDDSSGVFEITNNDPYSLAYNHSTYARIRFTPEVVGPTSAILHTGSMCGDILVNAEGIEPYSSCYSYIYHTYFNRVAVGDTAKAYIYISNNGYIDLEGFLSVDGTGFNLENPGLFTLPVGETLYEELWFTPPASGDYEATISTGLADCPGDWEVNGNAVPAGSDRMGFFVDAEGIQNHLITNQPKSVEKIYLVLQNPTAGGPMTEWYVNFWTNGPVNVLDWNTNLPGYFQESPYYKRFYFDTPVPFTETMVLADFLVMTQDPSQAAIVDIGQAFYKYNMDNQLNYVVIQNPVDLLINSGKSMLADKPASPLVTLDEGIVKLEWPCDKLDFEGFHVYRRMDDERIVKLTEDPVICNDGAGYFEDSLIPEEAFELHYSIASLFKGKESQPSTEVTLNLVNMAMESPVPSQTRLVSVYPNPFNPITHISFEIANSVRVQIKIYDVSGRLVRNLTDEYFEPGKFEEIWNGKDDAGRTLSSNVYYARMTAGPLVELRKMTLLK